MICNNCGRRLRDTKSMERGYGPICYSKIVGLSAQRKVVKASTGHDSLEMDDVPGQMSFADYIGVVPGK